jgi:hypothetical protein
MAYIIGVDPGKHGGLAIYDSQAKAFTDVFAFNRVSYPEIQCILKGKKDIIAYVEKPSPSRAGESISSARTFGEHIGLINGVLIGLEIPFRMVSCKVWERGLVPPLLQGSDRKRALKRVCQERFPELKNQITLDTCDAILIVDWVLENKI